jgi:hypothetical protein
VRSPSSRSSPLMKGLFVYLSVSNAMVKNLLH